MYNDDEWVDVIGYNGEYLVNRDGLVLSLKNIKPKILKNYEGNSGYFVVSLYMDNKMKSRKVHRLVAEAFIPNPYNKPFINHIDGNKLNNNVDNLEWCTHMENMTHAVEAGLFNSKGVNNGRAKITPNDVFEIIEKYNSGKYSQVELGEEYGIANQLISRIVRKKAWSHLHDE